MIRFWKHVSHVSMGKSTVRVCGEGVKMIESLNSYKAGIIFLISLKAKHTTGVPGFYKMYRHTSYTPESLADPWSLTTLGRPGIGCVVRYHTACKTSVAWIRLWSETMQRAHISRWTLGSEDEECHLLDKYFCPHTLTLQGRHARVLWEGTYEKFFPQFHHFHRNKKSYPRHLLCMQISKVEKPTSDFSRGLCTQETQCVVFIFVFLCSCTRNTI